jgi:hypothetical protein
MRTFRLFLSLLFAGAWGFGRIDAAAAPALALGQGETLTYRVGWGFIPLVGRITIAGTPVSDADRTVMRVVTTTATRGLVRGFFPFNARGESTFDAADGRLLATSESSSLRDHLTNTSVVFNYANGTAAYTDSVTPANSRIVPMPAGDPSDLILGLVQTRSWRMKPGDQRDELVIFDDDFYRLTVRAAGYEDVNTPLGVFRSLVLVPRMEKDPPKGMFKRGSDVRVWISEDERRLPVRFTVEFKFGRGTATLIDYRPPVAGGAALVRPAVAADDALHAANPRP